MVAANGDIDIYYLLLRPLAPDYIGDDPRYRRTLLPRDTKDADIVTNSRVAKMSI